MENKDPKFKGCPKCGSDLEIFEWTNHKEYECPVCYRYSYWDVRVNQNIKTELIKKDN